MTQEQQWSSPRRMLPTEINGNPVLANVVGQMIMEQGKHTILLQDIRQDIKVIARAVDRNPRSVHRRSLREYTDLLQAIVSLMLLLAAIMLWWREPDLFSKIALALAMK